jgi:hypothetical protein
MLLPAYQTIHHYVTQDYNLDVISHQCHIAKVTDEALINNELTLISSHIQNAPTTNMMIQIIYQLKNSKHTQRAAVNHFLTP